MVDWSGFQAYESDVRGYFPCCPICGSKEIEVHLTHGGRDTLSCRNCEAQWHIYVGLAGFKWAELDVGANDGRGAELLGKRLRGNEWQRMAQEKRKAMSHLAHAKKRKDTEGKITIIKEREIIKIRCPYCRGLYDESYDKCPHCGAGR